MPSLLIGTLLDPSNCPRQKYLIRIVHSASMMTTKASKTLPRKMIFADAKANGCTLEHIWRIKWILNFSMGISGKRKKSVMVTSTARAMAIVGDGRRMD